MHVVTPLLLAPDEPPAWRIEHADGRSDYVLICDHAGNRLPRCLGTLGLAVDALASHIAWDIGAGAVASGLGDALDACVVLQPYSRLVIDCNRPPGSADSIVSRSERTTIPGNVAISRTQAAARESQIFVPYHAHIRELLDARLRRGQRTLLIALHSFTPVYLGVPVPGTRRCSTTAIRAWRVSSRGPCVMRAVWSWVTTSLTPSTMTPITRFLVTARRAAYLTSNWRFARI